MGPNDVETYKANHKGKLHKRDLSRPHEARISMVPHCLETEGGKLYKVVFVTEWPEGMRSQTRRYCRLDMARRSARTFATAPREAKK